MNNIQPKPINIIQTILCTLLIATPIIPNGFRFLLIFSFFAFITMFFSIEKIDWQATGKEKIIMLFAALSLYWSWQNYRGDPSIMITFRSTVALLCLFLLFYFQNQKIFNLTLVRTPLIATSVFSFLISAYQFLFLKMRAEGAHFFTIHFGAVMILYALYSIYLSTQCKDKLTKCSLALASLLYIASSIFSQSRGGWPALILIAYIFYVSKIKMPRLLKPAILILTSLLLAFNTFHLRDRITIAYEETQGYFSSQNSDLSQSSVGMRWEMWRFATQLIQEKPLIGWGQSGYNAQRTIKVTENHFDPALLQFDHSHNDILNDTAKGGLIGLTAILSIYLVPILFFYKRYRNTKNTLNKQLAMLGLLTPLSFFIFGLSEAFFSWNAAVITLYLCLIAFFAANLTPDKA